MIFEEHGDNDNLCSIITLKVFDLDIIGLKMPERTKRLIKRLNASGTISDKLLALSILAKAIEDKK